MNEGECNEFATGNGGKFDPFFIEKSPQTANITLEL